MNNDYSIITKLKQLFSNQFWRQDIEHFSKWQQIIVTPIKVLIVSLNSFSRKGFSKKAAVLSFFSLLSIVPIIAVLFAIAKGFGFEEAVQATLADRFQGQEEVFNSIMDFSHNLLERTQGGMLALISIAMLLWSVLQILGNVENVLNEIWHVKKARTFTRKVSDYFSILFIAPILFLLSTTMTVYITTQTKNLIQQIEILGFFSPLIFLGLRLLPYIVISGAFIFVFLVIPNTRVKPKSAIIAGVIAGIGFQLVQLLYINSQVWVSGYNAIYGSFAAVPLFILWLNVSWQIILFGAEASYIAQNIHQYKTLSANYKPSHRYNTLLATIVAHTIIKNFQQGKPPLTILELSQKTKIPQNIISRQCQLLMEIELISSTIQEKGKRSYLPSISVDHITLNTIVDKVNNIGSNDIFHLNTLDSQHLKESLHRIYQEIEKSPSNIPLKDI